MKLQEVVVFFERAIFAFCVSMTPLVEAEARKERHLQRYLRQYRNHGRKK